MQLSQNSWHAKVYFFATTLFEAWKKGGDWYTTPDFGDTVETNLCPYMRRILWTLPLLLIFYGSVFFWLFYVALFYPLSHFGLVYLAAVATVAGAVGAMILIILGIVKVWPGVGRFWDRFITDPFFDMVERIVIASENCIMGSPDAPSFCAILRQWIIDKHHKICRDVTIVKGE